MSAFWEQKERTKGESAPLSSRRPTPAHITAAVAAAEPMAAYPVLAACPVVDDGPSLSTRRLVMYKEAEDQKLGVSFHATDAGPVRIRKIVDHSLAFYSGLAVDDVVIAINGHPCENALTAAATLRDVTGEIWVSVERHVHDVRVPSDSEEEVEGKPPGIVPRHEDDHSASEDEEYASDEYSERDPEEGEEATVDEWTDWLEWMIGKISDREAELADLQAETADALVSSMGVSGSTRSPAEQPPTPPSDADMADPTAMTRYMEAMALYSTRQQERLREMESEALDNREATAALALLSSRRHELLAYLDKVEELDEEAAARIETIWKELARDGDVEDDIIADEEASVAGGEVEAAVADSVVGQRPMSGRLGRSGKVASEDSSPLRTLSVADANSQPLSARVRAVGSHGDVGKAAKASLIAQRLQRARSSAGVLKNVRLTAKGDQWLDDEAGVMVHPI